MSAAYTKTAEKITVMCTSVICRAYIKMCGGIHLNTDHGSYITISVSGDQNIELEALEPAEFCTWKTNFKIKLGIIHDLKFKIVSHTECVKQHRSDLDDFL